MSGSKQKTGWYFYDLNTWQSYDAAVTMEIDNALHFFASSYSTSKQIEIQLTQGNYFNLPKNRHLYSVVIELYPSKAKIKNSYQKNTRTGMRRPVKRMPGFDFRKSNEFSWQWLDNNQKWIKYDAVAGLQIEKAWKDKQPYVQLNQGKFFGTTENCDVYLIGLSPSNLCQTNTKTNCVHKVRRTSNQSNPNIANYENRHSLPLKVIDSSVPHSGNIHHSKSVQAIEQKIEVVEQPSSNCSPNDNLQLLIIQLRQEIEDWKQLLKKSEAKYDILIVEKEKYYKQAIKYAIVCEEEKSKLKVMEKSHDQEMKLIITEMELQFAREKEQNLKNVKKMAEEDNDEKLDVPLQISIDKNMSSIQENTEIEMHLVRKESIFLNEKYQEMQEMLAEEKEKFHKLELNYRQLEVEKKMRKEFQSTIESNYKMTKELLNEKVGDYQKQVQVLSINEQQLKQQLQQANFYIQRLEMQLKQNQNQIENQQYFIQNSISSPALVKETDEVKEDIVSTDDAKTCSGEISDKEIGIEVQKREMSASEETTIAPAAVKPNKDTLSFAITLPSFGFKPNVKSRIKALGNKIKRNKNNDSEVVGSEEDVMEDICDVSIFEDNYDDILFTENTTTVVREPP